MGAQTTRSSGPRRAGPVSVHVFHLSGVAQPPAQTRHDYLSRESAGPWPRVDQNWFPNVQAARGPWHRTPVSSLLDLGYTKNHRRRCGGRYTRHSGLDSCRFSTELHGYSEPPAGISGTETFNPWTAPGRWCTALCTQTLWQVAAGLLHPASPPYHGACPGFGGQTQLKNKRLYRTAGFPREGP